MLDNRYADTAAAQRGSLRLLNEAQSGSPDALGELMEGCREYLLVIAQAQLNPALRSKAGASDLVQETFLKAHRSFGRFVGDSESDLMAWLRKILLRNCADLKRRYKGTEKRRLTREISLHQADRQAACTTNPENVAIASLREDHARLAAELRHLPDDYRRVLEYRLRHGLSFQEISVLLGRTPDAARMLWRRAVLQLSRQVIRNPN